MPSYEKTFSLKVPSSTENLAMIRDFVSNIGVQVGFNEGEVARLALAVDEACANVIEHAYGLEDTHDVTIRAVVDDDALRFEIIDTGRGFDPAQMQPQEVEELIRQRKSGGLGLRLIRTIMDDVQYRIVPGEKNELRMTKRLKKH
ncbi:ATP-binding protein [uncultured Paludibaculum sp.]|uniref:ATP-binding protein n=1 Tax=uncultured Paludibaculum sp. TaxID=1765020 RepID=UPI002AAA6359|nr:ATP-binding protein [uncultured Paludibaculum sp.]